LHIVKTAIHERLVQYNLEISVAENYEKATLQLKQHQFDFVILDLMIPAEDGVITETWSKILVEKIGSGEYCAPMHVFGLTEHEDKLLELKQDFDKLLFGLFLFDWDQENWADDICRKIIYLSDVFDNGVSNKLQTYDYDFLIVVARHESEFIPIRDSLFGQSESLNNPLFKVASHFGHVELTKDIESKVALVCMSDMGLSAAATIASNAIMLLRPRNVVMLGMCAGFDDKGLKLLDVVVARESACWQTTKSSEIENGDISDDVRSDYISLTTDIANQLRICIDTAGEAIKDAAQTIVDDATYSPLAKLFKDHISQKPKIKAGLVVSGSEIVASDSQRTEVQLRHRAALALEMEIHAIYTAAIKCFGTPVNYLAMKGVADFAGSDKGDDTDMLQPLASKASAEFFKVLAQFGVFEQD